MRFFILIFLSVLVSGSSQAQNQDSYIPIGGDGTAYTWAHNALEYSDQNRQPAPELNDGDSGYVVWLSHDVVGGPLPEDEADTWQAAGVIWDEPHIFIRQVVYHHGPYEGDEASEGAFSGVGSFHLQITTDGVTWQNYPLSSNPEYTYYIDDEHNGAEVSDALFSFDSTFPSIRGVRVLGLVRTSDEYGSFNATCRQIQVFETTSVQFISQPQSQTATIGETATFSVETTGVPPLTYRWYRNGTVLPGATGISYSTAPLTVEDDGAVFNCLAFDGVDSLFSQDAHLTVNPIPGGDLTLASNGLAHYQIYYGPGEGSLVVHAALELAARLEEISGASFQITTDENSGAHLIVVGRNNPLAAAIDLSGVEGDGFRLVAQDNRLFLAGNLDRGTVYAVYHFLDFYLGVRWFSPEYEVTPSQSNLAVAPMDDLENAHFSYREIFSGDTDDAYFRQHNRLNGNRGGTHRQYLEYPAEIDDWSQDGPYGGHNFQDIIGSVYHSGGQIYTMSQGVRGQAAAYFRELVYEEGSAPWYGFSQEDNGWNPDPDSQDFADAHGGALSAPILDMVIDIAQQIRIYHPDTHLSTIAYQWSFQPPTGMTVPEYVLVEAAPIEADFGYPYNHSRNDDFDFQQWNQTAQSLGIWDYIANFQNYLQPMPTIYPMCENIQYLSSLPHMKNYFGEGAYNAQGAEFAELRAWVAARLLWNPNLDYHALINEFCVGYYGAAGNYIVQYLDLLHQSLLDSGDRISSKQRITSDYLSLDFVLQADQLMAAADAAVGGAEAEHLHNVRLNVDMTILMREHLYQAEAEAQGLTWNHDPSRRARFEQYVSEAGIEAYAEDGEISELFDALDIDRVSPPYPEIVPEGRQWIDFQDMDMSICCGASLVTDILASDHGAVAKGPGEDWAIQMSMDLLPTQGEWTLYAYVRADLFEGASPESPAFYMGIYPGDIVEVPVSAMHTDQYVVFEFPNMPVSYQTGRSIWFSCGSASENIFVDRVVAVSNSPAGGMEPVTRHALDLGRNFPNPFNPSTTIRFSVPGQQPVDLDIYDVRGRKVKSLLHREKLAPGWHSVVWRGRDSSDRMVASGVYYCRLTTENKARSSKMVLLK